MLGINVGESVVLSGAWMAHPQYGRQFKAEMVRTVLPATIAGLEKYLGSGLIKGIGPVTAKRIVRKFGAGHPARDRGRTGPARMRCWAWGANASPSSPVPGPSSARSKR